MRILLISDFHRNYPALQAIDRQLNAASFDYIVNSGDCLVYAPFPNESIDWLSKNKAVSILGNTDQKIIKLLLGKSFKKPSNPEKRIMQTFTSSIPVLPAECLTVIREFPVPHWKLLTTPLSFNTLTRISHEHCGDFYIYLFFQEVRHTFSFSKISTMFTKGQSMRRHLRQYFASEHSLLWFTTKNFEADAA